MRGGPIRPQLHAGVRYGRGQECRDRFFLWHGESSQTTYDITKLLRDNPDALWNIEGDEESPVGAYHYWGEPLFGYYASTDKWVARRHVEMLTSAGVDFLALNVTNAITYDAAVQVLLEALDEYQQAGWDVPIPLTP